LPRSRLEELEAAGFEADAPELLVSLAWLAIADVPIDDGELKAARRRAMFVLAAGGDPSRELDLESVAAERLADELDSPQRRTALADALAALDTSGLPTVAAAAETLRTQPDAAWRFFALALIADELAGE
jgi:hypothetical protein